MSGVRTTSRLRELLHLRTLVDREITKELLDNPPPRRPRNDRLTDLGITAKQVKEWAVETGLVKEVKRGRVARYLIDAYAEAKGLR